MGSKSSPMKSSSKSITVAKIRDELILGEPNDLVKLIYVFSEFIGDLAKEANDGQTLRKLIISKIQEMFDDSGEEATELCFNMALSYGFISEQTDSTGRISYVLNERKDLDISHDWFCFDCDILVARNSQQFLKCDHCFRVFHRKCIKVYQIFDVYQCQYCERTNEWERDGYIGQQRVDQKRVNVLIGYLLDFVKIKMKDKYEDFDLKDKNRSLFVFKPMDLSIMKEKTINEEYKSVSKFEDDFFVFMHNLNITSFHLIRESPMAQSFQELRIFVVKEINELRLCVDCYEMSNDKALHETNKDWYCLPCDPPHEPVFVKIKGFPHWPAKVIYRDDTKKRVHIRFFDTQRRRMDVKSSDIHDINDITIRNALQKNQKLVKPMQMLDMYMKSLNLKSFGFTDEQTKSKETTFSSTKDINDSIEAVVQNLLSSQIQNKKRGRKKKVDVNSPSVANTSSHLPEMSDNSVNSISSRLPNLEISEQKQTPNTSIDKSEMKDKRRSRRISAHIRCCSETKSELKEQRPKVEAKIMSRHELNKPEECDQTTGECNEQTSMNNNNNNDDMNNDSVEMKEEVHNSQTDFKPFDNSVGNSNDIEFKFKPQLLDMNQTTDNITIASKESANNSIIENKNDCTTNITNESQNDCIQTDSQTESFGDDFEQNSNSYNNKFNELMAIKEDAIPLNRLKESLILMKFYREQELKALKSQLNEFRSEVKKLKYDLKVCKTENWCAICHNLAQFYCCLRFYCSKQCQRRDWIGGHFKECLLLKSDKDSN